MKKYWILSMLSLALAALCYTINSRSQKGSDRQEFVALGSLIQNTEAIKLVVAETGKDKKSRVLRKLYTKDKIDTLKLPSIEKKFLTAMAHQATLLKKANDEQFSDLRVEADQLEEVLDIFRTAKSTKELTSALDAYQLCGDGKGNVKFTGYYSPIIPVSRKQESEFEQPIYLKNGAKDDDLSVVYVQSREVVRSMKVEGTAYLKFPDGRKQMVTFDGDFHTVEVTKETSHDLESTEDNHKKAKATFAVFTEKEKNNAMGVGTVPLTTDFSIAIDREYIPMGSVLLAEVPILDSKGELVRHEYRYVLAQDVGGRIKGAGHIDLYMGEGDEGQRRMQHMNKYGKLWLLLPKEKETPKLVAQKL